MRAPISVIIPTLNAEADLARCLASLGEGLAAGLIRELVISDGESGDATRAIAEAAGAEVVCGAAGRGGQLRRGAAAAKGVWLLVIHADTELSAGWVEEVQAHITTERAACFRLAFRTKGRAARFVAGWANLRSRVFGLPYGDQGLLVSRAAYDAAGGYPDWPLMEDVALVRRLPRVRLLRSTACTGADRYLRDGWFRRGARNLWALARYFCGVSPETLGQEYHRR